MAAAAQMDHGDGEDGHNSNHCCLVGIGRLQVTSTPSSSDLAGGSNNTEFISRHSVDGKFTFVDQRSESNYLSSRYSASSYDPVTCIVSVHKYPGADKCKDILPLSIITSSFLI